MKILRSEFKLLSSLEKVFFEFPYDTPSHTEGSMLKNEIYSFQMASVIECDGDDKVWYRIELESELKKYIEMYSISYVPSMRPANPVNVCDDYITHRPGLFPDPMNRMADGKYRMSSNKAVSVWFSVEPKGEMVGTYPIHIKIYNTDENLVGELTYMIKIIDAELPKQKLINTGWLHGDCIASLHHTEVGSEEYWNILEKYIRVYSKFGHNMILTPVFTPPLDTGVGLYRPTNQLVDVCVKEGEYSFSFEKLDRWIDLCHCCGIVYFEISHLFTQWGAYHAPQIMAWVDGEYKRIFGWETESLGDDYKTFLNAFLSEFKRYLKNKGIYEKCYFHISDEPEAEHLKQYNGAKERIASYVDENHIIDALNHHELYQSGVVKRPVAGTPNAMNFINIGVKDLWVYYWCGAGSKVANRFMAMPSYRNRILGYQLYKYNIEGFLQWGFNFWYSQYSTSVINPYIVTDGDDIFPSGDAFMVYPLDQDGEVVKSFRLYVFNESLQDMRALELLESLTSREEVLKLLDQVHGFDHYPRNADYILKTRALVNKRIEEVIDT